MDTEKYKVLPNGVNDQQSVNLDCGYEGLVKEDEEGKYALSLLVTGVHCAVCIQKIESLLQKQSLVDSARLNFSTGRLQITWHGEKGDANEFARGVESLGYKVFPYNQDIEKKTSEKENQFLLLCLGVAGFAMGNLMLLSVGLWVTTAETMGGATRELLHWVSAVIAIPTIMFSGRPFFRSARKALEQRKTNMDVPISLAIILAAGMSLSETIRGGEHVYYDSAVMLTFFLLIGRYLDFHARRSAKSAAMDLMQTLSGFATVIEEGKFRRVLIKDLREEMLVSVAAGEKFPIDGVVETGQTTIDMSLVNGETMPHSVQLGSDVYAGTINLSSPVTIKVAKVVEDSLLADIVRMMEKAEQGQAKYVRLADKAARLYTPVVHSLSLFAFILWWGFLGADWQDALMISVTVLIITCPCALGLAVPVVQVLATGKLMKEGILVKSGDALEKLAKVNVALFDKTGTLTHGKPDLVGNYDSGALTLAASLAQNSKHPLSQALVSVFDGDYEKVTDVIEHSGKGLEGKYKGKNVKLGSRAWCGNKQQLPNDGLEIWLSLGRKKPVPFHFEDVLRDDTKQTIKTIKGKGVETIILSGDRLDVVRKVAGECAIEKYYGEQDPTQKFDVLQKLKEGGKSILVVGDGLNDAPILSGADVSIAPGSAIDIAQNAADIVFMGAELGAINTAHETAIKAQLLVKQNFAFATAYNLVAIPLALCGMVTPMIAAIAMSGSSLLVILNSFRLKLKK
jgi:Cu2+-exporting ATPase